MKVVLNTMGEISFVFTDTGEEIVDKAVLREIKKLPEIKDIISNLHEEQRKIWSEIQASSEEASREFIEIYKLTPKVMPVHVFHDRLANLRPMIYKRQSFLRQRPTQEEIMSALYMHAQNYVKGFFRKKKRIQKYIDSNYPNFAAACISQWEQEYIAFEQYQNFYEANANAQYLREYGLIKAHYERSLFNDERIVVDLIENWLTDLTIPADISAQIEYTRGHLFLDLDLPEIEDLPPTTTKQLKSGQVKIINKTQKQLKEEYAVCVLGLAFYVAANIFNLNANILTIVISGFTQRRNGKGDITVDYIYSVVFPREQLCRTILQNPITTFNEFENRMKLSTSFTFGKIQPYEYR